MYKSHKHLYLFGIALLIGSVVFMFPGVSQAQGFIAEGIIGGATLVFKLFAYLLNTFFSFLFMLSGLLVTKALELNLSVANTGVNSVVLLGWKICRDIANLGFVLGIVMIAFSTIIQVKEYGAQKLLIKFITAAVLVNFSLTIGGVFIDFSNVITGFFLSRVSSNSEIFGLTDTLAAAFGPQKLILGDTNDPLPPDPDNTVSAGKAFTSAGILSITGLLFTVIFTAISTIVMLTLAIMLIIRYVWLTLLLISAPIAWLFYALPFTSVNNWWWSEFTSWTFFAPASTFFIYIALQAVNIEASTPINSHFFQDDIIGNVITAGVKGLILSSIMIGGLIMAQKTGSGVANKGYAAAVGVWSGAKQYASNNARVFGQRLAQTRAGAVASRGMRVAGIGAQKIGFKGVGGVINAGGQRLNRIASGPKVKRSGMISSLGGAAFKGAFKKPENKSGEKEKVKPTQSPNANNQVTPTATAPAPRSTPPPPSTEDILREMADAQASGNGERFDAGAGI